MLLSVDYEVLCRNDVRSKDLEEVVDNWTCMQCELEYKR